MGGLGFWLARSMGAKGGGCGGLGLVGSEELVLPFLAHLALSAWVGADALDGAAFLAAAGGG